MHYTPAESDSRMFGGNSNWRGRFGSRLIFFNCRKSSTILFLLRRKFESGVSYGSRNYQNLNYVADHLSQRLCNIFLPDKDGNRAFNGNIDKLNHDEHFKNYVMFYEYFHGDNGRGVGASHQTGWTSTVAKLLQPKKN